MSVVTTDAARDLVVVSGSDAISFLQSLLSQDLDQIADGQGAHTLLLTPQGKLDVDFVYLRVGDEAWLICEGGFGPQLVASLNRFKIRVDVTIEHRADVAYLALRGTDAVAVAQEAGLDVPDERLAHAATGDARIVRVPWSGGDGVDVVGPASRVAELEAALVAAGVERVGEHAYEALRITAGVPRQGLDLDEKTIPQEAFLELDAVSFTKGCFLGQELVCRIDTRGHVNRYLRLLRDIDGGHPPRGSEIVAGDKVVGTVTSIAEDETQAAVALGYARHEVEPPAEVTLRWKGGEAKAVVDALPV